ncbi:alpha-L-fucosidase [Gramella jeungdoensis]|uniref:alpha-L-fucosidase n=1 Tax=Gramella jeungdoensis TaxID=708091 RepID=A0ABT0Z4P7_9FLAO|nr:alpha-L-fucosidase [Gramella jeungdoensis]MCM8570385.1 alpha-L-fucosidase [Gramella jeungdoensis]
MMLLQVKYSYFKERRKWLVLILILLTSFSLSSQEAVLFPVENTIKINENDSKENIVLKAAHVVPTSNQLKALRDGYIAFIHFGPNTFTRKEWGTGLENPKVFDLQNLDTDQWCKAIKEAGMSKVIFTAKHHDGFVLWQSRYTDHGIMSSPYKNGAGDILKELSRSCEKFGLKLGVYLSPADLYQIESPNGLYGNLSKYTEREIPRKIEGRPFKNKTTFKFRVDDYNEYFLNQLFELLTEYGPIHEVWFDGAHPKRKGGQIYNYKAWKELIRKLAPEAVIFGKEDLRWVGNEAGKTRTTEWNVIPYKGNPDTMEIFGDLTDTILGSREQLYQANYLHYQPAEVNTSIREGWFYRDENRQKVRTAEDIFDIYERAVGGNSIFLLNIPPNREGLLSPEDVRVLRNSGKRIRETYDKNLFSINTVGSSELLDDRLGTYKVIKGDKQSVILNLKKSVKINRFLIQESVATHGERVEKHILEAWVDNGWKEIATGTNIGFKKILRFPAVTSNRFRISFPKTRYYPAIATVSGHLAPQFPPRLEIVRNQDGLVSIRPKEDDFSWKLHGQNPKQKLDDLKIKYAVENENSWREYKEPFFIPNGKVRAVSQLGEQPGSEISKDFGLYKKNWKVLNANDPRKEFPAVNAIDANNETIWVSNASKDDFIILDLGEEFKLTSFKYTPPFKSELGLISKGKIEISEDGKNWRTAGSFEFGNLVNDPTTRIHYFKKSVSARYIKIKITETVGSEQTVAAAELGFNIEN